MGFLIQENQIHELIPHSEFEYVRYRLSMIL